MEATVKLDKALDIVWNHMDELAARIAGEGNGTRSYSVLWNEYERMSSLYDDIRRAAE